MSRPDLTLRDAALDVRCYAVRLGASMLGVPIEIVADPAAARIGPVLQTPQETLSGAAAILGFLATRAGRETRAAIGPAPVDWAAIEWAGASLHRFVGIRRDALLAELPGPCDADGAARRLLRQADDRLSQAALKGLAWLGGAAPGVADLLLFPLLALSHDLEIPMDLFPAARRYVARFRTLDGFVTMPGVTEPH